MELIYFLSAQVLKLIENSYLELVFNYWKKSTSLTR